MITDNTPTFNDLVSALKKHRNIYEVGKDWAMWEPFSLPKLEFFLFNAQPIKLNVRWVKYTDEITLDADSSIFGDETK